MPSTKQLTRQLTIDYPTIAFAIGERDYWNPHTRTVTYTLDAQPYELLHEVGHALLGHDSYTRDIELIKMERAAWTRAQELARVYGQTINEEDIQSHLDTYRDWLHARSICPNCQANGIQVSTRTYECPACQSQWQVNEARSCRLKRQQIK